MPNYDDQPDGPIRFDQSLPALVDLIVEMFDEEAAEAAAFIRDAHGTLAVVLDRPLTEAEQAEACAGVTKRLGAYARRTAIRGRDDPGAGVLLGEADAGRRIRVLGAEEGPERMIRLIDRRIVGADWMAPPVGLAEGIARIAFLSIKGGVGRSTALAVCAAHLARTGRRVLTVDLDMEAPGLGAVLLDDATRPRFGVVDWLIEDALSGIDPAFVADAIGASPVAKGVSVLPAFGTTTEANPADALAKIARAVVEDQGADGSVPFRAQVRAMLDVCAATGDYDVILIDGRAGLHETTAAVALESGARVLLFGRDEPQTFQGYRLLLAHVEERLPHGDRLRERSWFVHARAAATPTPEARERFQALWANDPFDAAAPEGPALGADDFEISWPDDESAAAVPLPEDDVPVLKVLEDTRFHGFDPLSNAAILEPAIVIPIFGELLGWLDEELRAAMDEEGAP